MKFVTTTPIACIQFQDVPVNRFFIDCLDELLIKLNDHTACRIAEKNGDIHARLFLPCKTWNVKEILPYDKVEF